MSSRLSLFSAEQIFGMAVYHHCIYRRLLLRTRGRIEISHPITMTSLWAWWRLKSLSSRLFTQPFIQAQTKKNIKSPRHWPLWREFTVDRELPAQRASTAENVSIWWRYHAWVAGLRAWDGRGQHHSTGHYVVAYGHFLYPSTRRCIWSYWRRQFLISLPHQVIMKYG